MGKKKGRDFTMRVENTASTTQHPSNSIQLPTKNRDSNRWVINLSSTPLTQTQWSLLAKGSNYVIAPQTPLILYKLLQLNQSANN